MRLAVQLLAFVTGAWLLGLALVGAVEWCVRHVDFQRAALDARDADLGLDEDDPK